MYTDATLVTNSPVVPTDESDGDLTTEAVMAYCQSRMDDLNGQANAILDEQKNATKIRDILNNLISEFQGNTEKSTTDPAKLAQLNQDVVDAIDQVKGLDPDGTVVGQLQQIHDNVMATGTGPKGQAQGYYGTPNSEHQDEDGDISAVEMQSFVSDLQSVNTDLTSRQDLQMVRLQSIMSDRQTAIQLTTNLIQSFGDADQKIAANIGH